MYLKQLVSQLLADCFYADWMALIKKKRELLHLLCKDKPPAPQISERQRPRGPVGRKGEQFRPDVEPISTQILQQEAHSSLSEVGPEVTAKGWTQGIKTSLKPRQCPLHGPVPAFLASLVVRQQRMILQGLETTGL